MERNAAATLSGALPTVEAADVLDGENQRQKEALDVKAEVRQQRLEVGEDVVQ